ncbi:MAG: hypothetical protein GWO24_30775, partial [Akkermansiaceae bacterium]|nr:hypothetical protein [Akkermansiaceae bacterium]
AIGTNAHDVYFLPNDRLLVELTGENLEVWNLQERRRIHRLQTESEFGASRTGARSLLVALSVPVQ